MRGQRLDSFAPANCRRRFSRAKVAPRAAEFRRQKTDSQLGRQTQERLLARWKGRVAQRIDPRPTSEERRPGEEAGERRTGRSDGRRAPTGFIAVVRQHRRLAAAAAAGRRRRQQGGQAEGGRRDEERAARTQ